MTANYYDNPDKLREVNAYIDELRAQDDRSCVIMIAARIESLLERAIDQRLIEPREKGRKGLVLNFANVIDLSYRLGILHGTHADSLHALRRIRNRAAHFDQRMSLEECWQDVEAFSRPWTEGRASPEFRSFIEQELNRSPEKVRAVFLVSASTFFVFLTPLPTIVPQLDRLPWLGSLDVSKRPSAVGSSRVFGSRQRER